MVRSVNAAIETGFLKERIIGNAPTATEGVGLHPVVSSLMVRSVNVAIETGLSVTALCVALTVTEAEMPVFKDI